jgi:hypothetical protein
MTPIQLGEYLALHLRANPDGRERRLGTIKKGGAPH